MWIPGLGSYFALWDGNKKKMISCHVSGDSQTKREGTEEQRKEQHGDDFPISVYQVRQWLKIVSRSWFSSISWFTLFSPCGEAAGRSPFDEALDQDHPAKFVSDVKLKEVLTSPWRAYAARLRLSAQMSLDFARDNIL